MKVPTIAICLAVCVVAVATVVLFIGRGPTPTAPVGHEASIPASEARMPPQMTFEKVFEPCAHCHEVGEGARTSSGPVLNGVVGREAASREDYPYSQAMKDSGIVWTEANMRRFLESPGAMVPETRMAVGGFTDEEIGPIIDFLKKTPSP